MYSAFYALYSIWKETFLKNLERTNCNRFIQHLCYSKYLLTWVSFIHPLTGIQNFSLKISCNIIVTSNCNICSFVEILILKAFHIFYYQCNNKIILQNFQNKTSFIYLCKLYCIHSFPVLLFLSIFLLAFYSIFIWNT